MATKSVYLYTESAVGLQMLADLGDPIVVGRDWGLAICLFVEDGEMHAFEQKLESVRKKYSIDLEINRVVSKIVEVIG
jgi:hypothetical protein